MTINPDPITLDPRTDWEKIQDAQIDVMRQALLRPDHSHTRWVRGFVHAYHYDGSSPSGVMLSASLEAKRYDALAETMRGQVFAGALSPLSPEEHR
jgi:hypothetical protein